MKSDDLNRDVVERLLIDDRQLWVCDILAPVGAQGGEAVLGTNVAKAVLVTSLGHVKSSQEKSYASENTYELQALRLSWEVTSSHPKIAASAKVVLGQ